MPEIKIIGFDPASTKNLGYCLMSLSGEIGELSVKSLDAGTAVFDTFEDRWKSLGPLLDVVQEVLTNEMPDYVIIEQTNSFRGGKSGAFVTGQVSHCIGVILAICSKLKLDVNFVYPTRVKKLLTGKGKATKSEMKKSVKSNLESLGISGEIKFDSDHASDATGNILAWLKDVDLLDKPKGD